MENRRTFMKKASTIAAVSAVPSFLIPQKKKKLCVALVGLGYYRRDLLVPALQLTKHC